MGDYKVWDDYQGDERDAIIVESYDHGAAAAEYMNENAFEYEYPDEQHFMVREVATGKLLRVRVRAYNCYESADAEAVEEAQ